MAEPQYAHYKTLPRQQLGLMSGQLWIDDPKMLGIHLARYKFVAKMLAGKKRVAEIGCGDGWYSKVVEQVVLVLELYDLDEMMGGPYAVQRHDIANDGKLPNHGNRGEFDAIYSLDCLEHIAPKKTDSALNNLCASLLDDGVFICGIPSLESQKYASEASRIGHCNCMSGEQMREMMQGYFRNVFMFGMSDEVVHTGFLPMSHYLIALCVGVK